MDTAPGRRKHNWNEIIEKWIESGQSVKEFCRENTITASEFYRNRKRLSRETTRLVKIHPSMEKPTATLIIETPRRYRLLLSSDFNAAFLGRVLAVLETER
jgi:transposase-like protein